MSFVIFKYSINRAYAYFENGTIIETILKNNENLDININNILVSDSTFLIDKYLCKRAISFSENIGKLEYYYNENLFNINPDYFKKDLTNYLNNLAVFTKSLPILVKIERKDPDREGMIYIEHSLINYKEYEIDDKTFEIDYSKVIEVE